MLAEDRMWLPLGCKVSAMGVVCGTGVLTVEISVCDGVEATSSDAL